MSQQIRVRICRIVIRIGRISHNQKELTVTVDDAQEKEKDYVQERDFKKKERGPFKEGLLRQIHGKTPLLEVQNVKD